MVTQMAWETAKVSRPFSLLSFLLYSIPPTIPLFSVKSVPLFSRPSVSFFAAVTFLCPVCSALTILSFSLFHPSVPFGSHPLVSFPRCSSGPPVNRVLCPLGQRLGAFLQNTAQTFSDTQGRYFLLVSSLRAHLETQNKTRLSSQSASEVLKGLLFLHTQDTENGSYGECIFDLFMPRITVWIHQM